MDSLYGEIRFYLISTTPILVFDVLELEYTLLIIHDTHRISMCSLDVSLYIMILFIFVMTTIVC